jgi:cobalt-zinc-cadmium efflux system protein
MHSHDHGHDHSQGDSSRRIGWAFFLNVGFTLVELVGGLLTNSTAIMADAVHDLGDSLSIGLAWLLARLSRKPASEGFSYGFLRFSLLGSLLNGVVMVVGAAWVLSTAVPRLYDPVMPVTEGMFGLAIFGIAVNGFAAFKLSKGNTLNERMLNWHLLEDVLGWVAVLIVSVVLMFNEWPILDPILSIVFTLFVLVNVVRNLWKTLRLFLQGTPEELSLAPIRDALAALDGVAAIHHLHAWSLDGEQNVLTAHLVLAQNIEVQQQLELKRQVAESLREYRFVHTTIEFEFEGESCRDSSEWH